MSEKIPAYSQYEQSKEISNEGNLSAMPPAFAPTAGPSDPNLGGAAQLKSEEKRKVSQTPVVLKSITVPGVPQELVDKLAKSEGIRLDVYLDSLGLPTVGVGHLLSSDEKVKWPIGTLLTLSEITALAKADIGTAWDAAQSQANQIKVSDEDFKVALFEVNFQLGTEWYTIHKKTWGYLLAQNWESAAKEAQRSKWANQTPARVENFQKALRRLDSSKGDTGEQFNFWEKIRTGSNSQNESDREQPKQDGLWGLALEAIKSARNSKNGGKVPPLESGVKTVKIVQTKLQASGLYAGKIDGAEFRRDGKESNTTKGLKAFQRKNGIPITGKIDEATWASLHSQTVKVPSLFDDKLSSLTSMMKARKSTAVIFDKLRELRQEAMRLKAAKGWKPTGKFVDDKFFVSQSPAATGSSRATFPGWSNCRQAATDIIIRYLKAKNPSLQKDLGILKNGNLKREQGFLRVLEEDKSHKKDTKEEANYKKDEWLLVSDQATDAIAYIDEKLASKAPVLVGVDHTFNRNLGKKQSSKKGNGYNEGTTDHYVTLTGSGRGKDGRKFYTYFEVGTKHASIGTSSENKLIEVSRGKYKAVKAGARGDQTYHISMVLIFPADRKRFSNEIKKNQAVVSNLNK